MNTTPLYLSLSLVLAALAFPTAAAEGDTNCTNYGIIIQAGSTNSYDCQTQYCNQGTGAGAGAGAGGPGSSEAGAEATAGTDCEQSQTDPDPSPCSAWDPCGLARVLG